jgi:peroxiredoxin
VRRVRIQKHYVDIEPYFAQRRIDLVAPPANSSRAEDFRASPSARRAAPFDILAEVLRSACTLSQRRITPRSRPTISASFWFLPVMGRWKTVDQIAPHETLHPGNVAPDITVPSATREEPIRLVDYRGRSSVLLGLFRGLYCAFCRKHVAEFGLLAETFRPRGVETIAIVATAVDRARLYFRHRPSRCLVGADPDLTTHRAFGVPRRELTNDIWQTVVSKSDELAGQLGLDFSAGAGMAALARHDGIDQAAHAEDIQRHQAQFAAQILIDREGIIRWMNVECARDGLAGLERLPTINEFAAAVESL